MTAIDKRSQLNKNLKAIREVLDTDVSGCDVESVIQKGHKLINLVGLASECKATARQILEETRLIKINELKNAGFSPSVLLKVVDANCANELMTYEYADRINAGISHSLDLIRSIISKEKEEMRLEISNNYTP